MVNMNIATGRQVIYDAFKKNDEEFQINFNKEMTQIKLRKQTLEGLVNFLINDKEPFNDVKRAAALAYLKAKQVKTDAEKAVAQSTPEGQPIPPVRQRINILFDKILKGTFKSVRKGPAEYHNRIPSNVKQAQEAQNPSNKTAPKKTEQKPQAEPKKTEPTKQPQTPSADGFDPDELQRAIELSNTEKTIMDVVTNTSKKEQNITQVVENTSKNEKTIKDVQVQPEVQPIAETQIEEKQEEPKPSLCKRIWRAVANFFRNLCCCGKKKPENAQTTPPETENAVDTQVNQPNKDVTPPKKLATAAQA